MSGCRKRLNDTDREEWVLNDEVLYELHRRSHLSMRRFVREGRQWIDEYINSRTVSRPPGRAA